MDKETTSVRQKTDGAGRGNPARFPAKRAPFLIGLLLGLSGCAGFMDEVTSKDFDWGHPFSHPNPLVVLQKSDNGNKRARALAALREPLQKDPHAQKDQEVFIAILTTAATTDRHPLCRLAAIRALEHFKDPRAAEALDRAFLETDPFAPEVNHLIKQEALAALGKTGGPTARHRLILVAREPPPAADSSEQEKQEALDRKLTAVRALAGFNHYEAAEALVGVLKNEKNTALRDRAQESLAALTGKNLPAEAKPWEDYLNQPANRDGDLVRHQNNTWATLVGWWH